MRSRDLKAFLDRVREQPLPVMETTSMDAMALVIGIDPGKEGGLAALGLDGRLLKACMMPLVKLPKGDELDARAVIDFLKEFDLARIRLVAVEKVTAMPGQGVVSMFTFGKGFGELLGIVKTLELPLELVTPQAWQKLVLAGSKDKSKAASVSFVKKRFPTLSLRKPGPRATKDQDGLADACCIAEWARRRIVGH